MKFVPSTACTWDILCFHTSVPVPNFKRVHRWEIEFANPVMLGARQYIARFNIYRHFRYRYTTGTSSTVLVMKRPCHCVPVGCIMSYPYILWYNGSSASLKSSSFLPGTYHFLSLPWHEITVTSITRNYKLPPSFWALSFGLFLGS